MELDARIAAWMKALGITQSELADRSGLSRAAICAICGGSKQRMTPSQASLNRIVSAMKLTMEQFYGRIPKAKAKKSKRAAA